MDINFTKIWLVGPPTLTITPTKQGGFLSIGYGCVFDGTPQDSFGVHVKMNEREMNAMMDDDEFESIKFSGVKGNVVTFTFTKAAALQIVKQRHGLSASTWELIERPVAA